MPEHGRPGSGTPPTATSTTSFPPTDWGLVLSAGADRGPALARLCGVYWTPAYAFVRQLGHEREQALDLVQEFFACAIDRNALERATSAAGPFRVWLLDELQRFLANRGGTERGAGALFESVARNPEEVDAIDRAADPDLEPEREYVRVLTLSVLERALARLEQDQADRGQLASFATLRSWLNATPTHADLTELGNVLGFGPTSTKIALDALRRRLASFLRGEIENFLERRNDPDALRAEMDALLGALPGCRGDSRAPK
jgi:hypothetical protein